ncbi:IS30 family transposase, partial [Rhodococcus sp. C3V]|nr:IS30 family transposase [Rhodococcus sp. C3V]
MASASEEIKILKEAFLAALRESGTVTEAARIVGANRNSAYAWAKKAGVPTSGRRGAKPHPGREQYSQLRAAGVSRRHAAEQAGVHIRTAQ